MRFNIPSHLTSLLIASVAIALGAIPGLAGELLITKNFSITIVRNCSEGNVICTDVTYVGVDRNSGDLIKLKGETLHRTCADGVTPCRFLGYRFINQNYEYRILDNQLRIYENGRLILVEAGEW